MRRLETTVIGTQHFKRSPGLSYSNAAFTSRRVVNSSIFGFIFKQHTFWTKAF